MGKSGRAEWNIPAVRKKGGKRDVRWVRAPKGSLEPEGWEGHHNECDASGSNTMLDRNFLK